MAETRLLVMNAADFGHSAGVHCAIVRAYRDGIVTPWVAVARARVIFRFIAAY